MSLPLPSPVSTSSPPPGHGSGSPLQDRMETLPVTVLIPAEPKPSLVHVLGGKKKIPKNRQGLERGLVPLLFAILSAFAINAHSSATGKPCASFRQSWDDVTRPLAVTHAGKDRKQVHLVRWAETLEPQGHGAGHPCPQPQRTRGSLLSTLGPSPSLAAATASHR